MKLNLILNFFAEYFNDKLASDDELEEYNQNILGIKNKKDNEDLEKAFDEWSLEDFFKNFQEPDASTSKKTQTNKKSNMSTTTTPFHASTTTEDMKDKFLDALLNNVINEENQIKELFVKIYLRLRTFKFTDKRTHYYLGYIYENGLGVPANIKQAIFYYALAAKKQEKRGLKKFKELTGKEFILFNNDNANKGNITTLYSVTQKSNQGFTTNIEKTLEQNNNPEMNFGERKWKKKWNEIMKKKSDKINGFENINELCKKMIEQHYLPDSNVKKWKKRWDEIMSQKNKKVLK